jgi:hypothetical protein
MKFYLMIRFICKAKLPNSIEIFGSEARLDSYTTKIRNHFKDLCFRNYVFLISFLVYV